jgi:hypothetical protein
MVDRCVNHPAFNKDCVDCRQELGREIGATLRAIYKAKQAKEAEEEGKSGQKR